MVSKTHFNGKANLYNIKLAKTNSNFPFKVYIKVHKTCEVTCELSTRSKKSRKGKGRDTRKTCSI